MVLLYDLQSFGEYGEKGVASTLQERDYKYTTDIVNENLVLRRLTPLECLRLQGMPDTWFDGVNGSDSAKYKAMGNAVALPCAYEVLRRIAEEDV